MNYGCKRHKELQFHLSEIFNLQHIIYSVSSEHAPSLAGYVDVIVFDRLTVYGQSPVQRRKILHNAQNNLLCIIWLSLNIAHTH